jgi:transcription antitermination factor NusG
MSLPWFALQVKYRHEKAVSAALRSKGCIEYLPLIRQPHRSGGRIQYADLPLFPTYVFCQLDLSKRLPVLMTPGVFSIVGLGKIPVPVDAEELQAIRRMIDCHLEFEPTDYSNGGDPVRVTEGPLKGTRGLIERIKNKERLIISVTILRRSVAVEIDRRCLQRELPQPAMKAHC